MQLNTAVGTNINELEIFKQRYYELETRNKELQNKIIEIEANHKQNYQQLYNEYLIIKERYELLMYQKFMRSAEKLKADDKQPPLFTEEEKQPETTEPVKPEEMTEVKSFKRHKAGRKPIDPNIKREVIIIDIPESEKTCACGAKLTRIGEETSEKLHMIPPRAFVIQTVRLKYACRKCEGTEDEDSPTVRIMPVGPSIIPKGIATPSLLSTIMTQKYEDHLPFFRQEKQFERIGVSISRQDMANWQQQVFKTLAPLFILLKAIIKTGPVMRMDETPVLVMRELKSDGKKRDDASNSYMWLTLGGPPDKTVAWYEYRQTRAGENAKEFLEGYSGYLQTDGYIGYDSAVKDMPGIIHVGCFAHVRRKFFEAEKISEQGKTAKEALEYIRKLYRIERELREEKEKRKLADEEFVKKRKEQAEPVLNDFKTWLLNHVDKIPPSLLLGKAIEYSLGQWDKLVRYLESPYLTPDNNASENAIRPFVIGRKAWMFNQSPDGAKSSCGMYTLIQTAKLNGLQPFDYLMKLFEEAPLALTLDAWEKLLPWNIFKS